MNQLKNYNNLASYHWETVEVSREEFRIPENYMNKDELYLFVSRDILDSHYDLSNVMYAMPLQCQCNVV